MFRYAVVGLLVVAGGVGVGGGQACTGLCQQQMSCPNGGTTSVSGIVYAPNGTNPLPNVVVYVPNAPVAPFAAGVSCVAEGATPSGDPLVQTTTAVDGSFTLLNVPVGTNIPLVIQLGRWRRQVTVPTVAACTGTAFSTRMPKNQSEGDIPKIALVTGKTDKMECALRDFGLDDAEFTNPGGTGRINFYLGDVNAGAQIDGTTPRETALMSSAATLNGYDMVMFASQGSVDGHVPGPSMSMFSPPFFPDGYQLPPRPADQLMNLADFVNAGGRAYLSHLEYVYLDGNPYLPGLANWNVQEPSPTDYTGNALQNAPVNGSFPEGEQFSDWLQVIGPAVPAGVIGVQDTYYDVPSVPATTQSWYSVNGPDGAAVQQFVAHTPVGAANACGRVVYEDYLVEAPVNMAYPQGQTFPSECYPRFQSEQEIGFEYNVFELLGAPAVTVEHGTLVPAEGNFGPEALGFTTPAMTFTWTNPSSAAVTTYPVISKGDFTMASNNCATVVAGGSCTIGVVFTPSALGNRSGTLTVNTAGPTGSATSFLSGVGVEPLSLSATELQFGPHDIGTSTTMAVTVTSVAPGPVAFPAMTVTGDYAATTTCGSTVPATSSCLIEVTFTPAGGGLRSGILTVGSTQVDLEGVGENFSVTLMPGSGSVEAGLGVSTKAVLTPNFGFTGTVVVTCSTTAPGVTCAAGTGTLDGTNAVKVGVTIQTTSKYTVVGYGGLGWLGVVTGVLVWSRRRRVGRVWVMALLVGVVGLSVSGCSGKYPAENAGYTPAGNYVVTVMGTDGILQESAIYQLKVTAP